NRIAPSGTPIGPRSRSGKLESLSRGRWRSAQATHQAGAAVGRRSQTGAKEEESEMKGHIRRRGERSWELKFDLGTDPLTGKRFTRCSGMRSSGASSQTIR